MQVAEPVATEKGTWTLALQSLCHTSLREQTGQGIVHFSCFNPESQRKADLGVTEPLNTFWPSWREARTLEETEFLSL